MKKTRIGITLLLLTLLAACSHPQQPPYPGIKVGKPYAINGRTYEPSYDEHYDEIGMASWYGPGFHGGKTANGERYNQNDMTAAHRTLPLPSIVRVTNLENGRSVLVKVNDRGPFARSRIIDLSHATAERLGMLRMGTAKVRVEFMDQETRQYVDNWRKGGIPYAMSMIGHEGAPQAPFTPPESQFAMAPPPASPQGFSVVSSAEAAPLPPSVEISPQPLMASSVPGGAVPQAQEPSAAPAVSASPDEFAVVTNEDPNNDVGAPVPGGVNSYVAPATSYAPAVSASDALPPLRQGFFVQAGTFGIRENAENLLRRLESMGSSQVTEIMAHEKKLYRVMMGPYSGQADAKNMLSKLASLGIPDAKIIRN